ncbi:MAG: MOSC domain-containing protein [Labilithrix sp.]|nr:MOSC domain-containing protein [Labilithrix sp.]
MTFILHLEGCNFQQIAPSARGRARVSRPARLPLVAVARGARGANGLDHDAGVFRDRFCYVEPVRIASLHVYPLKGARGIALERAEVLATGIRHDRRFMALDEDGAFVTQRAHPSMALVGVAIAGDRLSLSVGGASATVPLAPDGPRRRVRVWDDEVEAIDVGGEGAELLSQHLGQRCSLVFMPLDVIRPVESPYGRAGDRVGFADAYPVLVAALASLADLNARLEARGEAPVPIDRFRANVVVDGGAPFEEETATSMRLGALSVRTPKRSSRCQVTTVDQVTAATSKEPLRTLARYRAEANKVYFAMNAIPDLADDASARVEVGDLVTYVR